MARAGCLGFTPGKDGTSVVGSGWVDFLKPASCMAVGVLVFASAVVELATGDGGTENGCVMAVGVLLGGTVSNVRMREQRLSLP